MSDENKLREELKAQAAEVIDAMSLEELESVSGGTNSEGEWYTCPYCGKQFPKGGHVSYIVFAGHMAVHVVPDNKSDNGNP